MVADHFLVQVGDLSNVAAVRASLADIGLQTHRVGRTGAVLVAEISKYDAKEALPHAIEAATRAVGTLATTIEPDFIVHGHAVIPNDPEYDRQWGLSGGDYSGGIHAPQGWEMGYDASDVVVAVIDTGIRPTHEDLRGNLWTNVGEIPGNGLDDDENGYVDDIHGMDTLKESGGVDDPHGHGTHVAGIIGASGNNSLGIAGVAWNVQLMAVRFLGEHGGSTSDAVEAIEYAVAHGAQIINASWGGPGRSSILETAIREAGQNGVLFVASAGNDGVNIDQSPQFPAAYGLPTQVTVAATRSNGLVSLFSNFGFQKVGLGAPGINIVSCLSDSDADYGYLSGTSMAAPYVTGAAALARSHFGPEPPEELVDRLMRAARPIPGLAGSVTSGGMLDLERLLNDTTSGPPNDDFENAIEVSESRFLYYGSTRLATGQQDEQWPYWVPRIKSVWFSLTPTKADQVTLTVSSDQFTPGLAVYTGGDYRYFDELTKGQGAEASVLLNVSPGTTYSIRIESVDERQGVYRFEARVPPPNDAFGTPRVVSGTWFEAEGDNQWATPETDEPAHASIPSNRSLWWLWKASDNGPFTLSTYGSSHDTVLSVYKGSVLDSLTQVAANDNAAANVVTSALSFGAIKGQIYRIAVDSPSSVGGRVRLSGSFQSGIRFTAEPEDINTRAGSTVTFTATIEGIQPISYQWFKDGEIIPGANDSSLVLSAVGATDLGTYRVKATNRADEALSRDAVLSIGGSRPKIIYAPYARTVHLGESSILSVYVDGSSPLEYRWYKDGLELPNQATPFLKIADAGASDAGLYHATVTNPFGRAKTYPVRIDVSPKSEGGWHIRFPSNTPGATEVVYTGERFFAFGKGGEYYSSIDGTTWEYRSFPSFAEIEQIVYGNGLFLARTNDGALWKATEELQWNSQPVIENGFSGVSIEFGNDRFVTVGAESYRTSTDGQTWSPGSEHEHGLDEFFFFDGQFWAIWLDHGSEREALIQTSPDAVTWTAHSSPDGPVWDGVLVSDAEVHLTRSGWPSTRTKNADTWLPGPQLPSVGTTIVLNNMLFSHSGLGFPLSGISLNTPTGSWTTIATSVSSFAIGDSKLVLVTSTGQIQSFVVTDGMNLPRMPDPPAPLPQGMVPNLSFANGMFFIEGRPWYTSTNGALWSPFGPFGSVRYFGGELAFPRSVAFGNGVYTTGGLTASTPAEFAPNLEGSQYEPRVLAFIDDRFVGLYGEEIITSTDGHYWTSQSLPSKSYLVDLAHGNGRTVVVGKQSILVSEDKVSWTAVEPPVGPSGDLPHFTGIAFGAGTFLATTWEGILYRSTDGLSWTWIEHGYTGTPTEDDVRVELNDIAYGNGFFTVVSRYWVFESSDTISWIRYPAPTLNLNSIVFGNGNFVACSNQVIVEMGQATNEPPQVTIENPKTDLALRPGQSLKLKIRAIDPEGQLLNLRLSINGTEVTSTGQSILDYEWSPQSNGQYTLMAQAADVDGAIASEAVQVTVRGAAFGPIEAGRVPMGVTDAVFFQDQYYVLSQSGLLWRSSNLEDWMVVYRAEAPEGGQLLVQDDRIFLFQSGSIAISDDGIAFIEVETPGKDRAVKLLSDPGFGILIRTDHWYFSPDGYTWSQVFSDLSSYNLVALNRGKILFFDVSRGPGDLLDENGKHHVVQRPIDDWMDSLIAKDGVFLATGAGKLFRSSDGLTWESTYAGGGPGNGHSICYANGDQIILQSNYETRVTLDGTTWRSADLPRCNSIVRFNDVYFASDWQTVYRSSDLLNWEIAFPLPEHGGTVSTTKLVPGRAGILACPKDGIGFSYSKDGVAWKLFESSLPHLSVRKIAYGNGTWVATGQGLWAGSELGTLRFVDNFLEHVVFCGGRFIAEGAFQPFYTSTDGREWGPEDIELPEGGTLRDSWEVPGTGQILLWIDEANYFTTSDFTTWTHGTFPGSNAGLPYLLKDHLVFLDHETHTLYRTIDAVNWTSSTVPDDLGEILWSNGIYLAKTGESRIALSPDLETWESASPSFESWRSADSLIRPTSTGFYMRFSPSSGYDYHFKSTDGQTWTPTDAIPRLEQTYSRWYRGKLRFFGNGLSDWLDADLKLSSIQVESAVLGADDPVALSLTLSNPSKVPVKFPDGIAVAAQLALDDSWQPTESTHLGVIRTGSIDLQPGAISTITLDFTLPAGIVPGSYRVNAWIDAENEILENCESNNYASTGTDPITVPGQILQTSVIGQGSLKVVPFLQRYGKNSRVTLIPVEHPGSAFAGWEGLEEAQPGPVTIRMNADRTVTARFERVYALTTRIEGSGTVRVNPDDHVHLAGSEIELSATAAEGWGFANWDGSHRTTDSNTVFAIEEDSLVVGKFFKTYGLWATTTFTEAQIADPDISGAEADPDKDGTTNRGEYLSGSDPLDASSIPTLEFVRSQSRMSVRFTLRQYTNPNEVVLEKSPDGRDWTPIEIVERKEQPADDLVHYEADLGIISKTTLMVRLSRVETSH